MVYILRVKIEYFVFYFVYVDFENRKLNYFIDYRSEYIKFYELDVLFQIQEFYLFNIVFQEVIF